MKKEHNWEKYTNKDRYLGWVYTLDPYAFVNGVYGCPCVVPVAKDTSFNIGIILFRRVIRFAWVPKPSSNSTLVSRFNTNLRCSLFIADFTHCRTSMCSHSTSPRALPLSLLTLFCFVSWTFSLCPHVRPANIHHLEEPFACDLSVLLVLPKLL